MTKADAKKKAKKETNEKTKQLIYCGPSLGLKVTKNAVYIGGIPKSIDKEISECKEIEKLFVPIEQYIETKQKINEIGTVENLLYRAVESYLKEG